MSDRVFRACGTTHSTHDFDTCSYWVAEIPEATYREIRRLAPLCVALDLAQIRKYSFGTCEWFEQLPGGKGDYDSAEVYDDDDWTGEAQECLSSQCDHLIITDDHIWFEANDKYSGIEWSSNMISIAELKAFFEGEAA